MATPFYSDILRSYKTVIREFTFTKALRVSLIKFYISLYNTDYC